MANPVSNTAVTLKPRRKPGAKPRFPARGRGQTRSKLTGRQRMLLACGCQPVDRPPVWLMRQAGRALPEYRALKEKHSFLQLVQTPDLAAEVTLQPIRRFGFDAAILFSDILVVPEAMGQPYHFRESGGIQMDFAVNSGRDIAKLCDKRIRERLQYEVEALSLIRAGLGDATALLGFVGSPWTLANFMTEGGSAKEFQRAKALYHENPRLFGRLMEKLTRAVTEFLRLQVDAGVDAVQIFDTLGGSLAGHDYMAASGRWIQEIVHSLDRRVPVIVFAKGVHGNWNGLVATGASVLGVDWTVRMGELRAGLPANMGLQGNLDPFLLTTTPKTVAAETKRLLHEMAGTDGFIVNLGHGLLPTAKLECIESLVATVKSAA